MNIYPRQMQHLLRTLIHQFPSILFTGPRQVGNGVIINHYPQKMWLAQDLLAVPFQLL